MAQEHENSELRTNCDLQYDEVVLPNFVQKKFNFEIKKVRH